MSLAGINLESIKTYCALSCTILFWGLSFVATKSVLNVIPVFVLLFSRFFIATLVFLVLMKFAGFPSFTRRDHGKLLIVALFEPGLYYIFETVGLKYTTASKASLIIATIPVVVTVSAALFAGEKIRRINIVSIIFSLVGTAVLVTYDKHFSGLAGGSFFGDFLIFGAVLAATVYILMVRDLGKTRSALHITAFQFLYGTFFFIPLFIMDIRGFDITSVGVKSVAAVFYLALCCTVAAYFCYNYAMARLKTASDASIFINGVPVVTVIGAWIVLGETLTMPQFGGAFLILIAVYLSNRKPSTWTLGNKWSLPASKITAMVRRNGNG